MEASQSTALPLGAKVAGFFIEVIEGRETAALPELRAMRDKLQGMLDAFDPETKVATVTGLQLTGLQATIRDQYVKGIRQIEALAADLERRIQMKEAEG